MTKKTLTPSMARHAVMQTLMFLRSEGAGVVNMGGLVLDETDGFPNGVTLGTALDVIANANRVEADKRASESAAAEWAHSASRRDY